MRTPLRLKHGAGFWIESRYPRNSKWLRPRHYGPSRRGDSRDQRSRQHHATARYFKFADRAEGRFIIALDSTDATYLRLTRNLTLRKQKGSKRVGPPAVPGISHDTISAIARNVVGIARIQGGLLRSRRHPGRYPRAALYRRESALDELGHEPPLTHERFREALAADDVWLGRPQAAQARVRKARARILSSPRSTKPNVLEVVCRTCRKPSRN